jgi:hypothetical protein
MTQNKYVKIDPIYNQVNHDILIQDILTGETFAEKMIDIITDHKSTTVQAIAGVDDTTIITPLKLKNALSQTSIITTTTTLTGTLTVAQEIALPIGISKNATTGEVWIKTADGLVTKIENMKSTPFPVSTVIPVSATAIITHNLNDTMPFVELYLTEINGVAVVEPIKLENSETANTYWSRVNANSIKIYNTNSTNPIKVEGKIVSTIPQTAPVPTSTPANLSVGTATATTQPILNSNGTGVILSSSTSTTAGLMSATDTVKLASLSANPFTSVPIPVSTVSWTTVGTAPNVFAPFTIPASTVNRVLSINIPVNPTFVFTTPATSSVNQVYVSCYLKINGQIIALDERARMIAQGQTFPTLQSAPNWTNLTIPNYYISAGTAVNVAMDVKSVNNGGAVTGATYFVETIGNAYYTLIAP